MCRPAKAGASSAHSKVAPTSFDVNVNTASPRRTTAAGAVRIIVFGAVVSTLPATVQVYSTGSTSIRPYVLVASTESECSPSANPS